MATEKQKTIHMTHVRVSYDNRDRAKEISRQMAAREKRDMPYTYILDEILNEGLAKRERKLGIVYDPK